MARSLIKPKVLRQRLGNISPMTEWRRRRDDPNFPKVVKVNNLPYYDEGELDTYLDALVGARSDAV